MKTYNIDLFKIIAKTMASNLDFIKIYPNNILIFGCDYSQSYNILSKIYNNAKFIELDIRKDLLKESKYYVDNNKFKEIFFSRKKQIFFNNINEIELSNKYDILWSNLFLVNKFDDIDSILKKWIHLLKKGGMLFFSILGLETLKEVFDILKYNDIIFNVKGLFDIQELGDKLFNYNFKDSVLYSEKLVFNYKSYSSFHRDLEIIYLLNNLEFKNENEYRRSFCILKDLFLQKKLQDITFEILYIHALKDFDYNTIKLFPVKE